MAIIKDRNRQGYKQLISQVAALDPEAAMYMKDAAKKLDSFYPCRHLDCCFPWAETPQGKDYWEALAVQLGQWEAV